MFVYYCSQSHGMPRYRCQSCYVLSNLLCEKLAKSVWTKQVLMQGFVSTSSGTHVYKFNPNKWSSPSCLSLELHVSSPFTWGRALFIGPKSDHWLCLSLTLQSTDSLTHSVPFKTWLMWPELNPWVRCAFGNVLQLKTICVKNMYIKRIGHASF